MRLAATQDNWYGTVHFVTMFRNHLYGDIYNNPPKDHTHKSMQIAQPIHGSSTYWKCSREDRVLQHV